MLHLLRSVNPHRQCLKHSVVRRDVGRDCRVQAPAPTSQFLEQRELESYNVMLLRLFNVLIGLELISRTVKLHISDHYDEIPDADLQMGNSVIKACSIFVK